METERREAAARAVGLALEEGGRVVLLNGGPLLIESISIAAGDSVANSEIFYEQASLFSQDRIPAVVPHDLRGGVIVADFKDAWRSSWRRVLDSRRHETTLLKMAEPPDESTGHSN
jgi:hypothetical protein